MGTANTSFMLPALVGKVDIHYTVEEGLRGHCRLSTTYNDGRVIAQTYPLPDDLAHRLSDDLEAIITETIHQYGMHLLQQMFEAMAVARRMGE